MGYDFVITSKIVDDIFENNFKQNTKVSQKWVINQVIEEMKIPEEHEDIKIVIPNGIDHFMSLNRKKFINYQQEDQIQERVEEYKLDNVTEINNFRAQQMYQVNKQPLQQLQQDQPVNSVNSQEESMKSISSIFSEEKESYELFDIYPIIKCVICDESHTIKTNKIKSCLICKINYCKNCLESHIQAMMERGKFIDIPCPGENCKFVMTENDIKEAVNLTTFSFYKRIKAVQEAFEELKMKNIVYCPEKNCHTKIERSETDADNQFIECPSCKKEVCFKCRNIAHPYISCEQYEENYFNEHLKNLGIKCCPQCKKQIQKNGGCDHMTCTSCQYQFCWVCLSKYSYSHFSSTSIYKCTGIQEFIRPNEKKQQQCFNIRIALSFIWVPLYLLLLLVLYHEICPFVMAIDFFNRRIMSRHGNCGKKVLYFTLITLFSIISYPICLIISIIPGYYCFLFKGLQRFFRNLTQR